MSAPETDAEPAPEPARGRAADKGAARSPAAAPPAAWPLIRRLMAEYGIAHWQRYAFAFVLMAIAAGATALTAWLIGEVVNRAYVDRDLNALVWLSGVVAAIFITKGIAMYGQAVVLARIANRIVAAIQRRLFAKLLHETVGFVGARHSSEFVARLNAGAVAAGRTLNLLITAVGRDLLTLVGLVAVMVYQDPLLSLIGLVVGPPAILVLGKLVRRVKNVAQRQVDGGIRVLETLQETLRGFRIVKAFGLEAEMLRRADADIEMIEQASNKMARVSSRASPLMETLGGLAIAAVILYSGYRVVEANVPPGAFVSFLTAFLLAYEPAKRLARLNLELNAAIVAVRALFDVADGEPAEAGDGALAPLAAGPGRVELRDVRFAYRADEPVLRGLSLVAEPGRMTALVGPSGGGKSTVLALILRFHDPEAGTVAIDDQNLAAVSRASLRQRIAYVGQDVFLFSGSIRDNIALGRPGASDEEVVAAAKAAFAHDFIAGFPDGYATRAGEQGLQLSGGQRQRIAIARALIRDAPIILLDEATAALDSESEQEVQRAIARLCEGRTTIVIAHRLSTIRDADTIHVIERGEVTESGSHDDLLYRGGRYADFYRLQLRGSSPERQAAEHALAGNAQEAN